MLTVLPETIDELSQGIFSKLYLYLFFIVFKIGHLIDSCLDRTDESGQLMTLQQQQSCEEDGAKFEAERIVAQGDFWEFRDE